MPNHLHIVYEIHPPIEDCGGPDQATLIKNLSVLERAKLAVHTFSTLTEVSDDNLAVNDPHKAAVNALTDTTVAPTDEELAEVVMTLGDPETPATTLHKALPLIYNYKKSEVKRLDAMLSELDEEIVNAAVRLRAYTTNKLLHESDNPDPKVRIKALELLGKIKDVGLFSEKLEITHKTKSDEELEAEIRKKLEVYMGNVEIVDVEEEEKSGVIGAEIGIVDVSVDIDKVFGGTNEDDKP